MTHPLFEIVTTTAGALSIRNKALGEIMHNPVGPWIEANALYIDQSRLADCLTEPSAVASGIPLVIYDVGLGAAANALATLHCAHQQKIPRRHLHLVSFERDLELLRFALENAAAFAHFAGWEKALKELLDFGRWSNSTIQWDLRQGDFLQTIETEPLRPHLVYYDPYSQKVNREMWTREIFKKLYQKSRHGEHDSTTLFTYSQSTPVRMALLQAGFYVGHGRPTGHKEETTQAATALTKLDFPLGQLWLQRWLKSHTKTAYDAVEESTEDLYQFMRGHPQFQELIWPVSLR